MNERQSLLAEGRTSKPERQRYLCRIGRSSELLITAGDKTCRRGPVSESVSRFIRDAEACRGAARPSWTIGWGGTSAAKWSAGSCQQFRSGHLPSGIAGTSLPRLRDLIPHLEEGQAM